SMYVSTNDSNLSRLAFISQFQVPEDRAYFLRHIAKNPAEEVIAITFATDIELPEFKKIEQSLGQKVPVIPLPDDLIIYRPSNNPKEKTEVDESQGGAFHKKKASNSKTYNIGAGTKAKMTMKNKKR